MIRRPPRSTPFPTRRSSDLANPNVVNSPTFVLIQEYDARLPIFHFDAYRLTKEADFVDLGVHEYYERTPRSTRSEEHTSELQSPDHLVCRLLLEKKKTSDSV